MTAIGKFAKKPNPLKSMLLSDAIENRPSHELFEFIKSEKIKIIQYFILDYRFDQSKNMSDEDRDKLIEEIAFFYSVDKEFSLYVNKNKTKEFIMQTAVINNQLVIDIALHDRRAHEIKTLHMFSKDRLLTAVNCYINKCLQWKHSSDQNVTYPGELTSNQMAML